MNERRKEVKNFMDAKYMLICMCQCIPVEYMYGLLYKYIEMYKSRKSKRQTFIANTRQSNQKFLNTAIRA